MTDDRTYPPTPTTYRVLTRAATVRAEPRADAPILRRLSFGATFRGREVLGKVESYTVGWVQRAADDGGGYVLRALVDAESPS